MWTSWVLGQMCRTHGLGDWGQISGDIVVLCGGRKKRE